MLAVYLHTESEMLDLLARHPPLPCLQTIVLDLVAVLAPFVVLVVKFLKTMLAMLCKSTSYCPSSIPAIVASIVFFCGRSYLGKGHIGNNNDVDGAGSVLGLGILVTSRVVLVFALTGAGLPRHAGLGHLLLGCG